MDINVLASSSRGNCYIVNDGKTQIMLDCGILWTTIKKLLDYKTSDIEACLISHRHSDHIKGLRDAIKSGLDVYINKDVREHLKSSGHRVHVITPMEQFKVKEWAILPFPLEHDCENLGYLLSNGKSKVLYITDSYYCKYSFKAVTHLLIECNHSYEILEKNNLEPFIKNRLIQSHFSLENVKKFLLANDLSKLQEVHLIHLSDGNSNAEQFKKEVQQIVGVPVYVAEQ